MFFLRWKQFIIAVCDAMIMQLQPESLPVFMMEPALTLTPLVATDFDAVADHVASIPAIVSPTMVGILATTLVFFF